MDKKYIQRIAIVLAFLAAIIVIAVLVMRSHKSKEAEIKTGLKKLKQIESIKVADVEKEMKKQLEEEEEERKKQRAADEELAKRTPNQKMETALVAGDSRVEGFLGYQIVDASKAIAEKGIHLIETEAQINEIAARNPENLFLAYGLNDVEALGGDTAEFRDRYREVLENVKEKLPNSDIYVSSVISVQQKAIDKTPAYAHIGEFNNVLQALCEEEEVTYVELNDIIQEDDYETDGIHFKSQFYEKWVTRYAEVAGL